MDLTTRIIIENILAEIHQLVHSSKVEACGHSRRQLRL